MTYFVLRLITIQFICRVDTAIWMHFMDANKTYREKTWRQLHKNAVKNIERVLKARTQKTGAVSYLPNPPLGQDMTQDHFLSGV